ncbi:unnamed protein product, partial [marine sediment metagenome]
MAEDKSNLLKIIETLKDKVSGRTISLDDNKNLIFNFNDYDIFLGKEGEAYMFKLSKDDRVSLSILTSGKFEDYKEPLSELYSHCVALAEA